jgi:hypothetical protein
MVSMDVVLASRFHEVSIVGRMARPAKADVSRKLRTLCEAKRHIDVMTLGVRLSPPIAFLFARNSEGERYALRMPTKKFPRVSLASLIG